jgi:hypothetical protein
MERIFSKHGGRNWEMPKAFRRRGEGERGAAERRGIVGSECVVGSPVSVDQFSAGTVNNSISLLAEEWAIKEGWGELAICGDSAARTMAWVHCWK